MDIYAMTLLGALSVRQTMAQRTGAAEESSFAKLLSEAAAGESMKVKDMLEAVFPACEIDIKEGDCTVSGELWQRKDFPVWKYFREDTGADSLNDWKPKGKEPVGTESNLQKELKAVPNKRVEVLMPESLKKKMEEDPACKAEIAGKLKNWKLTYDWMNCAAALSSGCHLSGEQEMKSYCLRLNESGEVEDYAVISGGINNRTISTQKSLAKDRQDLINHMLQNIKYQLTMAPFRNSALGGMGAMGGMGSLGYWEAGGLYSSLFDKLL